MTNSAGRFPESSARQGDRRFEGRPTRLGYVQRSLKPVGKLLFQFEVLDVITSWGHAVRGFVSYEVEPLSLEWVALAEPDEGARFRRAGPRVAPTATEAVEESVTPRPRRMDTEVTAYERRVAETIVRPSARPVLAIRDNKVTTEFLGPDSETWAARIDDARGQFGLASHQSENRRSRRSAFLRVVPRVQLRRSCAESARAARQGSARGTGRHGTD